MGGKGGDRAQLACSFSAFRVGSVGAGATTCPLQAETLPRLLSLPSRGMCSQCHLLPDLLALFAPTHISA